MIRHIWIIGSKRLLETTMFYIIAGLMNQDEGEMVLSDKDIQNYTLRSNLE